MEFGNNAATFKSLARMVLIIAFFCLAECAAGSCLSYGHSCWGGHGKRSGPNSSPSATPSQDESPEAVAAVADPEDARWFISKLMIPSIRQEGARLESGKISLPRSGNIRIGSEESSQVVLPAVELDPPEEPQDIGGDLLVMADEDQTDRHQPRKLKLYKILSRAVRKYE